MQGGSTKGIEYKDPDITVAWKTGIPPKPGKYEVLCRLEDGSIKQTHSYWLSDDTNRRSWTVKNVVAYGRFYENSGVDVPLSEDDRPFIRLLEAMIDTAKKDIEIYDSMQSGKRNIKRESRQQIERNYNTAKPFLESIAEWAVTSMSEKSSDMHGKVH